MDNLRIDNAELEETGNTGAANNPEESHKISDVKVEANNDMDDASVYEKIDGSFNDVTDEVSNAPKAVNKDTVSNADEADSDDPNEASEDSENDDKEEDTRNEAKAADNTESKKHYMLQFSLLGKNKARESETPKNEGKEGAVEKIRRGQKFLGNTPRTSRRIELRLEKIKDGAFSKSDKISVGKKKTNETQKKTSETQKKTSETEKKTSETQKKTSETEKKTSETQKKTSETQKKPNEKQKEISISKELEQRIARLERALSQNEKNSVGKKKISKEKKSESKASPQVRVSKSERIRGNLKHARAVKKMLSANKAKGSDPESTESDNDDKSENEESLPSEEEEKPVKHVKRKASFPEGNSKDAKKSRMREEVKEKIRKAAAEAAQQSNAENDFRLPTGDGSVRPLKYNCADCGKRFKFAKIYLLHLKIHKDKKYSCDVCGDKFLQHKSLSIHTSLHKLEIEADTHDDHSYCLPSVLDVSSCILSN